MIWPRQPARFWLTEAGAGALVPRVVAAPEFEAVLWEEDHHGFWIEWDRSQNDPMGTRLRLIRKDFVASMELGSVADED